MLDILGTELVSHPGQPNALRYGRILAVLSEADTMSTRIEFAIDKYPFNEVDEWSTTGSRTTIRATSDRSASRAPGASAVCTTSPRLAAWSTLPNRVVSAGSAAWTARSVYR